MKHVPQKDINEIFAYWQKVMDHPSAKLLPVRSRKIAARLREGYTVEQIMSAIDGCKASPFHQGRNEYSAVYDDLTLICRDGSKLEYFINLNTRPPRNLDRIAPNTPAPAGEPAVCSACRGTSYIDSHPDTPGFVPGRSFTPCSACSPPP